MNPPNQNPPEKAPKKRTFWACLLLALLLAGLGIFYGLFNPSEGTGDVTAPAAEEEPAVNEFVILIGEVEAPGKYAIPRNGNLSLMAAIEMAGGMTELANVRRIQVLRDGGKLTADLRDPEDKGSSLVLRPNDRVTVALRIF